MVKTLPTNSIGETIRDGVDVDKTREPKRLLFFVAMVVIIAYSFSEHTRNEVKNDNRNQERTGEKDSV